ncbi:MAG: neutral zinc metallopeptidase [Deltaproteobacteria bacterium]|nr:neutral zinc metallopeptidase [Deltaproteobacteria bacterium]MBW2396224.1 neutral zinc metallopeptidase [Deltaproteobacteria bacterium]
MRWERGGGRSRNVEDRRGERVGRGRRMRIPLPRGGLPMGGRKMSLGGVVLLLLLMFVMRNNPELFAGVDGPTRVQVPGGSGFPGVVPGPTTGPSSRSAGEDEAVEFVSFVIDDLNETWGRILPGYRETQLVLFRGAVRSGCGTAQSAMGPFYCPADRKVYIDLGFYHELRQRFGAPGDFAQAYVLAHEIGHHIQTLSGLEARFRQAQQRQPRQRNPIQVRMELQADCLAGVWGHSTAKRNILEPGDVEEAMHAAAAIGDDRIQEMSTGQVRPEAFTHGSSEQRMRWFSKGLESGDPNACDTFDG